MKIIKVLSLFSLTLVATSVAKAETWTLDSCISYAIRHNVEVRQQEMRVKEGELAVTEAKDRFLPTLDAGASQSFNFGRGLTAENTYANRNTSSTQWNVGFNLPLFQGMSEYSRLKGARLSLSQYLLEVEAAKDNLTLNVISQYLQVLYSKEMAKAARSQAELSAFEVERQKVMVEAGKVAEATLYDVESVAAQDRLQVVTADNDVRTAIVNLANLLHLPSLDGFDVAPLEGGEGYLPSPEEVYSAALGSNNGLLGARQAIRVADEN
ncbi:MAG: TolC family protein, partial [Muribaculaceae bacterium]|nr:TolC family protein [Muribaculaceae bacterium]